MSLFKERAANAKKVIALQNEIFSLKNQLASQADKEDCNDCAEHEEKLKLLNVALKDVSEELKSLKAENKKLKADLKKATKKLASKEEK